MVSTYKKLYRNVKVKEKTKVLLLLAFFSFFLFCFFPVIITNNVECIDF